MGSPADGTTQDHRHLVRLMTMIYPPKRKWYMPTTQHRLAEHLERLGRGDSADDPAGGAPDHVQAAVIRLSEVAAYTNPLDIDRLPSLTLERVPGLPDDVARLIGSWVCATLGLTDPNIQAIGRLWQRDAAERAWRLLVDKPR